MKKILNWTFGGFFRALGRILCFLVVGGLIAYLIASNDFKLPDILSFGIMRVNAAEINYTGQFRLQYFSLATGDSALTNVGPFNTGQTLSSGYGVSKVIARYYGTTYTSGTTYRVATVVGFAPSEIASNYRNIESIGCFGTTSSSNWNADNTLVECSIVGVGQIPNTNRIKYIVDITPNSNIQGLQFNINYAITEEVRTVNVYTASTITTGPDITSAIDDQTIIIQEEFENITNVIEQNNQNLINSITEQNQVCTDYDLTSIKTDNAYINRNNGNEQSANGYGITDYININGTDKVQITLTYPGNDNLGYCFYNVNKVIISCGQLYNIETIDVPNNAYYFRGSIQKSTNKPQYKICKNGNQALTESIHGLGEGIHDKNTSEATNEASNFFNNFSTNTHGLTSIITAPLTAIQSLSSSTCTPLHLPIPYLDNQYIDLPCMRGIYVENFGLFMTLYDTIAFGIVSYWIIVRIFSLVKDFKNPEHDEIEVVDL